jgi:hypothetical protein
LLLLSSIFSFALSLALSTILNCAIQCGSIPRVGSWGRRHFVHSSSTRLLITVWRRYCFRGQIHSIPGYWSIPQYSWSNLFLFPVGEKLIAPEMQCIVSLLYLRKRGQKAELHIKGINKV